MTSLPSTLPFRLLIAFLLVCLAIPGLAAPAYADSLTDVRDSAKKGVSTLAAYDWSEATPTSYDWSDGS